MGIFQGVFPEKPTMRPQTPRLPLAHLLCGCFRGLPPLAPLARDAATLAALVDAPPARPAAALTAEMCAAFAAEFTVDFLPLILV